MCTINIILGLFHLLSLPSLVYTLLNCHQIQGNLDLSNPPCHCRYDQQRGWMIFQNEYFQNLTNDDIDASIFYENSYNEYTKRCDLRSDKRLYCVFEAALKGHIAHKNVTVIVKRRPDDGSIRRTTFRANAVIKYCNCSDVVPELYVKQTSWDTIRATWKLPTYMKYRMHNFFYSVNGKTKRSACNQEDGCEIKDLKPSIFGEPVRVCLSTTSSLCLSIRDVCKDLIISAYHYFDHFSLLDGRATCKLYKDNVQLNWGARNVKDMEGLGFMYDVRVYDSDNGLLQIFSTSNSTSIKSFSEKLREEASYYDVRLCLSSDTCSKKQRGNCERPQGKSLRVLLYIAAPVLFIALCVGLYYSGICPFNQTSSNASTQKDVVDFDVDIILPGLKENQYETMEDTFIVEEVFDNLEIDDKVKK